MIHTAFVARLTAPANTDKHWISTRGGGYNQCIERRGHWCLPNCFSGDTEVITRYGTFTLESLVGKSIEVLSLDGIYRKATCEYFGRQELYLVTLRNGDSYKCTANHRWVTAVKPEVVFRTTDELHRGDMIPYNFEGIGSPVYTTVSDIIPLRFTDDVYCIKEPETHTMTLKGNILTGQCVGYAWGRFLEILGGTSCKLSPRNAGLCWGNTKDGYERGKTPRLGAVICWAKGKEPGHVAVVEQINSDGSIVTSESGYSSKKDFWTQKRKSGGNWGQSAAYQFQGFIYNPNADNGGITTGDAQSTFVNTAKGYVGRKFDFSLSFIKSCANEAGILGTLIPNVFTPSDIGTQYDSGMGEIKLGPANGYTAAPKSGDIALIRTNYQREYNASTACDYAGIVYEVKGNNISILELDVLNKVVLTQYTAKSNMIAAYYCPNWSAVWSSSDDSQILYQMSEPLYTSKNTKEDAIVREVAYLSGYTPTLNRSGIRLSAVNYTTLLSSFTDNRNMTGEAVSSISSDSEQTYILDGMTNQNARVIMQFLLDKGLLASQAVGFLANIQTESGFLPSAVNKSSGASGICQWFQSRRTAMIQFVGANWKDNLTGQCEYLWYELNNSEKKALEALRNEIRVNTEAAAEQATLVVLYKFERPGRGEAAEEKRKGYARNLWRQLVPQLKTV